MKPGKFPRAWFDYIKEEQPQKAHQLTLPPHNRRPFNEALWSYYRNNPRPREALKNSVANPAVRALLALGPRARVQFYDTAGQSRGDQGDSVEQLYAVTYDEDGERKSFFIALRMSRAKEDDGKAGWRIVSVEGGVVPNRLKKAETPSPLKNGLSDGIPAPGK